MSTPFMERSTRHSLTALVLASSFVGENCLAQEADNSSWNFRLDAYVWTAGVGGESANGTEIDIDFDDLAKDMELGFMSTIAAERGRWLFELDLIYLDIEHDDGVDIPDEDLRLKTVELTGWIPTAFAGYRAWENDTGTYISVLAGARYLDLDLGIKARNLPGEPELSVSDSESDTFLDGVVGVIGRVQLNERWALPYYLDVGAGDSDTTWQVYLGVSYAFESFELMGGYRYLDYKFDDDPAFDELDLGGPMFGARWRF